ncbi:MAG: glycosyl hydrolase [Polyangiaceae bacterium]
MRFISYSTKTRIFGLLFVLGAASGACSADPGYGDSTGGATSNGGSSNGGSANGGSANGGSSNGGASNGGSSNGGATNGGASNGGASNAGATSGGSSNGGTSQGGSSSGGASSGGRANGGTSSGGTSSGGTSSGGAVSGGRSSGGASSGGVANGGSASGGAASGGRVGSGGASGGTTAQGGSGSGGVTASGGSAGSTSTSCNVAPANPNATAQAKKLLCYLYSQYGNHVISGQQETSWSSPEADISWYVSNTGKYPAILGGDYLYPNGTSTRAIAYWNAGGIPDDPLSHGRAAEHGHLRQLQGQREHQQRAHARDGRVHLVRRQARLRRR